MLRLGLHEINYYYYSCHASKDQPHISFPLATAIVFISHTGRLYLMTVHI